MDKLSLSTSDTFTTSNNLEKLPNEIIMMILEKIPPSLVFTLIKSSKKINTLFNKSKNSIIKNNVKYHGGVNLVELFLYKKKDNEKEFKEAIDFVYQFICENGIVNQIDIKKWIKGVIKRKSDISADEAIIILEFIKKNTRNSSKFLLDEVRNKLNFDASTIEQFDILFDVNYELSKLWEGSYEIEENWPDNHMYDGYVDSIIQKYIEEGLIDRIKILEKKENIDLKKIVISILENYPFSDKDELKNFKKYFPDLYHTYNWNWLSDSEDEDSEDEDSKDEDSD